MEKLSYNNELLEKYSELTEQSKKIQEQTNGEKELFALRMKNGLGSKIRDHVKKEKAKKKTFWFRFKNKFNFFITRLS